MIEKKIVTKKKSLMIDQMSGYIKWRADQPTKSNLRAKKKINRYFQ